MKKIIYLICVIFVIGSLFSCTEPLIDGLYFKSVSKTDYFIGETFDCSTLIVEYIEQGIIITDFKVTNDMIIGFDSTRPVQNQKITVKKGKFSCDFYINIIPENLSDLTLQSIELDYSTLKTFYFVGDSFNKDDLVINRIYKDKNGNIINKSLTGNVDSVVIEGFDSSKVQDLIVKIKYEDKSIDVPVFVNTELTNYATNKYTNPNFVESNQSTWKALNCHDPKLFQDDDGTYYVYSTDASIGNVHKTGIQIRKSKNLIDWECLSTSAIQNNWDSDMLEWVGQNSQTASTWAPTVIKQNGKYYMMHGIITDAMVVDGKKRPAAWIGLAISDSPTGPFKPAHIYDPQTYSSSTIVRYAWKAQDEYASSLNTAYYDGKNNKYVEGYGWSYGFGAIDPEFVYDMATGTLMTDAYGDYYIIYGSWKGGIALMTVDNETFMPTLNGQVLNQSADQVPDAFGKFIAGGNGAGYEGAQLIYNSDNQYYYLFVSMGDLNYEYRVGVGRSKNIEGPYLDASGNSLSSVNSSASNSQNNYHNRGNKIWGAHIFEGQYGWSSPGGLSICRTDNGKLIMAAHTRTTFRESYFFYLQTKQMFFTENDWPVLHPCEYSGEELNPLTETKIVGVYDTILTQRDPLYEENSSGVNVNVTDATATKSKVLVLKNDNTISGEYSGSWSLSADGINITIDLKDINNNSLGKFKGIVSKGIDFARKGTKTNRYTISFSTICDEVNATERGEHFFGNKK